MKQTSLIALLVLSQSPSVLADSSTATATAQAVDADPADPADPAAPAADASATAADAPAATRWPRDIISRVLTLPQGLAVAGFDVTTPTSAFFDPAGIRALAGYGITDDLEVAFGHYAFPTDDVGKGSIDGQAGFKLLRGAVDGKLEVIARGQFGYNLGAEGANPILLGVHAQYNITPKLAVITPGGQVVLGVSDKTGKAKHVLVPVSVGYQLTPTLYFQFDTTVAQFELSKSANAFIFADTTPLFFGAYYNALPALDVIAGLGLNATPPDAVDAMGMAVETPVGDTVSVLVGARYYIGKL